MDTVLLCRLDAVPDGGACVASTGRSDDVVVVRRGQRAWAYLNRCPHFSVCLDYEPGDVLTYDAQVLMCAHHSALFRFEDGHCIEGPCAGAALTPVAVQVVDGEVRCWSP
ncbi:Rieske (2Fe-2S) protein [Cupriavidus nantongensis]|uniref:4-nitrocatechol monooxygenase n=1 Tax=Cupriavidus nantongensis TaxID=1796606 RepID=A0A142JVE4_9BURK|nr:Rieske 2Fe-2S domain-containing protein [Cupriavidus nantongensis]AMR82056.1 4-nitrocatechol monooxygenase [Cupriavidus nantongensis]